MNNSNTQTFTFTNGRTLRVIDKDDQQWFVLVDVLRCVGRASGISNIADTLARTEGLSSAPVQTGRGLRAARLVSLTGLTGLLGRSRSDSAHAFRVWVQTTVLPKAVPVAVQREFFGNLPHVAAVLTKAPKKTTLPADVQAVLDDFQSRPVAHLTFAGLQAHLKELDDKTKALMDAHELAWYRKHAAEATA